MNIQSHGIIHFKDWANSYIPNILNEIYLQGIYYPFLVHKKDAVFLDLGSHIGLWSMYASQFAKQIYSFEPTKETYDIAVKNITDNKITNVKLIQKAVAAENVKTTFYHCSNNTMNSLNPSNNNVPEENETVETIRLDDFVKQEKIEHIDFAKIDVEGVENKIFASESFKNIVPILDAFIYEYHTWTNVSPSVINFGLKELGYLVKQIPSEATIFSAVKL